MIILLNFKLLINLINKNKFFKFNYKFQHIIKN